jgi:hypothetical protein
VPVLGYILPFTCFHFNCHYDKEENIFPDLQSHHGHPMLQTSINEKTWKTEKGAAYQIRINVILSQSPFVSICSYLTARFTATYSPVFPVNEQAKFFVCVSKQILPCGQSPFHKCVFLFPSGPFISGSVSLYSSNLASLSIRVAISVSAGTEKGESKRVAVEIYHRWGKAPIS